MRNLTNEEKEVYDYINKIEPYCVLCGKGYGLHRHHIRYGGMYGGRKTYIGNIIVLCDSCHRMVHTNKEYWVPKLIKLDEKIRKKFSNLV